MATITPIFYQSWEIRLPLEIENENNKYIPKTFEYKLFTLEDVRKYLLEKWPHTIEIFDNYKRIEHKIDLWRYCILYETGGVYMDADCVLKNSIELLLKTSNCIFVTNNRGKKDIFNGFIATFPKNPILKDMIDYMLKIKNSFNSYYFNCIKLYYVMSNYVNIKKNCFEYTFAIKYHNNDKKKIMTELFGKKIKSDNKYTYFNDSKIIFLIDKKHDDKKFYAYFYDSMILEEENSLYPYPKTYQ